MIGLFVFAIGKLALNRARPQAAGLASAFSGG